jgi:hypothetical protein
VQEIDDDDNAPPGATESPPSSGHSGASHGVVVGFVLAFAHAHVLAHVVVVVAVGGGGGGGGGGCPAPPPHKGSFSSKVNSEPGASSHQGLRAMSVPPIART